MEHVASGISPHNQRVLDYFNQTHSDYRRLWGIDRHLGLHCGFFDERHRRHDDAVTNMNRVLASFAGVSPGMHVLDAGCGIGGSAVWLAENRAARVTGVNISPMQVRIAEEHVRRRGLQELVDLRVADFSATGLVGEMFDLVWALESLCYAEDKRQFLAEAYRLLKPGGRIVVADAFLTREDLSPQERRIVERWREGWAIPGVESIGRFREMLTDAGYRDVRFRDVTRHVTPSSRRIFWGSLLFYPLGLLLCWTGFRTPVQTRGIASGYYQYRARQRGLGVYGFFYAEK